MLRTVNSWLFFQMIDQRDETSALDFLDKGGFDIDYKTKGQHGHITALHLACKFGCVQVLQTLIQYGAKLDAEEKEGNTPLHWACKNGQYECANLLLRAGAPVDHPNDREWTPLFFAVQSKKPQIVKLLIEFEADINHCSNEDGSPIYLAVQ